MVRAGAFAWSGGLMDKIHELFQELVPDWVKVNLINSPWWQAASTVVVIVATYLLVIDAILPDVLRINLADPTIAVYTVFSLAVIYLFSAAMLFYAQVKTERRLKLLDRRFRYDNRGTLFNGTEPNISFRIQTFQGILRSLRGDISVENFHQSLEGSGRTAAEDFSKKLPEIYDNDVFSFRGGRKWAELSFKEKLDQWAEYNSYTGWGIVTPQLEDHPAAGEPVQIIVIFTHYHTLFSEQDDSFCYFLTGYCETIISEIVRGEKIGIFADLRKCEAVGEPVIGKYTATMTFRLT